MGLAVITVVICSSGCSDPNRERLKATTKATYDERTGRLKELTSDANGNGRIDTWTEMDGNRALRSRMDRNEDGRMDRWEYYDGGGQLVKVGFSRRDDGKPDAWAEPSPDGRTAMATVVRTGGKSIPPAGCRRLPSMRTATAESIVDSRIRKARSC